MSMEMTPRSQWADPERPEYRYRVGGWVVERERVKDGKSYVWRAASTGTGGEDDDAETVRFPTKRECLAWVREREGKPEVV